MMMQSFGAYNAGGNVVKIAARTGSNSETIPENLDTLPDISEDV